MTRLAIQTPLCRADHVPRLVAAGSDEFYCGFSDAGGAHDIAATSHRQGRESNFVDEDDLRRAVGACHDANCSIALTLNARSISDESAHAFSRQVDMAVELGMDAVIVGNMLGLVLARQRIATPVPRLYCGVNVGVLNAEAAKRVAALGATRVVLSRHLLGHEIAELAKGAPDVEFEVFVKNCRCGYYDAYCGYHYDRVPAGKDDSGAGCRFVRDPALPRFQRNACSACMIADVIEVQNVTAAKIAGRDMDVGTIEGHVRYLREVIDAWDSDPSRERHRSFAKAAYGRHFGVDCPARCDHAG